MNENNVKCPKCGKNAHLKRKLAPVTVLLGGTAGGVTGWVGPEVVKQALGPETAKLLVMPHIGIPLAVVEFFARLAGALGGAAAGAYAGEKLGGCIDKNVSAEYECDACGHRFKR